METLILGMVCDQSLVLAFAGTKVKTGFLLSSTCIALQQ